MKRAAVAKRYARALVDLAGSMSDAVALADELDRFGKAIQATNDLRQVLMNPVFLPFRPKVVEGVAGELSLGMKARQALRLLLERDRMRELSDVVDAMRELVDGKTGKVRATVTSATELPEDRYQRIRAAMERLTGRTVTLEKSVDPSLIGGVVTRVGSVVYDGSVRAKLRDFRASFKKEN